MFYLLGPQECIRNLILLSACGGTAPTSADQLRKGYLNYVASVSGPEVRPLDNDQQITYSEERIANLIQKWTAYSPLTDLHTTVQPTPPEARVLAMEEVIKAKDALGEANPLLLEVFNTCVHTIFYHRSPDAGGGTVSSALGVIWCALRKTWTTQDIAEFLVHEMAHTNVFLDERVHQHYLDANDLVDSENFAVSAVLEIARPLDKVFHSLVVAHEVLAYREVAGVPEKPAIHPTSPHLIEASLRTIDSINDLTKRRNLVTPRFHDLMGHLENSFKNKYSSVQANKVAQYG